MKHPWASGGLAPRFVLILSSGALAACAGILGIDSLPEQSGSGYTIQVVSGGGQSGQVGQTLTEPLVVEVRDVMNAVAANRTVTFSVSAGGGYLLDKVKQTTGADGRASIHWALGPAAQNEVSVAVEGVTATAKATATNPWQLEIGVGLPVGRMYRDGPADAARFGEPSGLTFGGDGKLYITDTLGHTVRQFDLATRELRPFVGTSGVGGNGEGKGVEARLNTPYGVARDGANGLIVAVTNGNVVQRVKIDTAEATYLAGDGRSGMRDGIGVQAQFNFPYAVDVDDELKVAYVTDLNNHVVREINLGSGQVKVIAGTPGVAGRKDGPIAEGAQLNYPAGITHDKRTLYVSDNGNARIRVIDLVAGSISTLTSKVEPPVSEFADGDAATARFKQVTGIAFSKGFLYVTDRKAHAIRRVTVADGSVLTIAGSPPPAGVQFGAKDAPLGNDARFFQPQGVAVSPDGQALYVAEAGSTAVRRVALSAGFEVTTAVGKAIVPTNGNARTEAILDWPRGLALAKDKMFIAQPMGADIRQVDLKTLAVTRLSGADDETNDGSEADKPRYGYPTAITVDETKGVAYVACGDQTVRRVDLATGAATTIAGTKWQPGFADKPGAEARFQDINGIALDAAAQKLYLADLNNHRIRVIDLAVATYPVSTLAGGTAGYQNGTSVEAHFNYPRGLVLRDNGLYVSDSGNHVIRHIQLDPSAYGKVSTIAGKREEAKNADGAAEDARFVTPSDLVIQGDLLYVADIDGDAVRRIHLPSGNVSTLVGRDVTPGPMATPKKPGYLVVRPGGEVFFSTFEENVVFRIGPRP